MKRVRVFIDASLLIAAARGNQDISDRALEILDDPGNAFVTSDFVRLEVLPKAVFHVAAAKTAKCQRLVTGEKPDKPLFRVRGLIIQTIRS